MSGPAWRSAVVYNAAESGWWLDRVGEHFRTRPVRLAAQLGLRPDIFDRAVASCSTGERQRLALLRAFEQQPLVLLLDEPTGALDPESTAQVELLLTQRLAAGMTLILVTHDPAQANRLGTIGGRLVAGRITLVPA